MKLLKNKFVISTIILMIGGFITKLLGMFIRILTTRVIGTEGLGIYMLIMPTFSLFMTIAQLGFPVAISTLVANDSNNNKNLIFSSLPVSLGINMILMLIIFLIAPFLANDLLKDPRTYFPLISIGFVLPFISISSVIRGYFFGKQRMIPHTISHISEQVIRIIIMIIATPIFMQKGIIFTIVMIILMNIVSELLSIVILIFFLPKHTVIKKEDIIPQKKSIMDILEIGIPTTGSRLIGSLTYFFEPIILTFVLLKVGYPSSYIVFEYGIFSGYVLPLLMIPSFFTQAISSALIPAVSKAYTQGHYQYVLGKLKQAIIFSLLIGIPVTISFLLMPSFFLKLVYNTTIGVTYLKILAPIFILYYIQVPFTALLQATNHATTAMNATLIGAIIRTILLFVLSYLKIGMYGLLIATATNIVIVTTLNYRSIRTILKKQDR